MPCLSPRWAIVECALFKSFSCTTFMISFLSTVFQHTTCALVLPSDSIWDLNQDSRGAVTWKGQVLELDYLTSSFLLTLAPSWCCWSPTGTSGTEFGNCPFFFKLKMRRLNSYLSQPLLFLTFDIFDNSLYYFSSSPGPDSDSIFLTSLS